MTQSTHSGESPGDSPTDSFVAQRRHMIDSQLRPSDVGDPRILAAMSVIAREDFVPAAHRATAYIDRPISLGGGRAINAPLVTGRMVALADIRSDDHVLVVGAGSGYTAAVAARLADSVVALEADAHAAAIGKPALAAFANVTPVSGPLEKGWEKGAPYSLILIDGAVDHVPPALARQLDSDGRLVCAVNDGPVTTLVRGVPSGKGVALVPVADLETVPLAAFSRPRSFAFG